MLPINIKRRGENERDNKGAVKRNSKRYDNPVDSDNTIDNHTGVDKS